MDKVRALIDSGTLELYVLRMLSAEENKRVEEMAASHPQVAEEIAEIEAAMELYAKAHAQTPPDTVKSTVMAAVDYMQRIEAGEEPVMAPLLTENSSPEDFRPWLERPDMSIDPDAGNFYAKIIESTPEQTTAIAWLRTHAPKEIHHDLHEKFLIVEGSCVFEVGEEKYHLRAGDFIEIPLHTHHHVKITSDIPCKAIVQRTAVA